MNLSYIRTHATELLPSSCCLRKIREINEVNIKEEYIWLERVLKC